MKIKQMTDNGVSNLKNDNDPNFHLPSSFL